MTSATNGGSSDVEALTPAQKLLAKHTADEVHQPHVEDVIDEEDLPHPPPSSTGPDTSEPDTVSGATRSISEVAKGKQKVQDADDQSAKLNTESEEAFPALGPPKGRPTVPVAQTWAKKPAIVSLNGNKSAINGKTPSSTTSSSPSTPASAINGSTALPGVALPGRHVERITFAPNQIKPPLQMKKTIPQVLLEINQKSKAKVTMKEGVGGVRIFEGTGPVDAVRQALREIANQIGSKVSTSYFIQSSNSLILLAIHHSCRTSLDTSPHYRPSRCNNPSHEQAHGSPDTGAKARTNAANHSG